MIEKAVARSSESGCWWALFQPHGYAVEQEDAEHASRGTISPLFNLVFCDARLSPPNGEITQKATSP